MKKYWLLILLLVVLLIAAVFAWQLYALYTAAFGTDILLNATRADWGVLGDFFGGTLNPIFSFLGLIMLLVTLFQNQTELELSRNELKESSQALKAQASTLDKQRFEDTFFALLNQLNNLLEQLLAEGVRHDFEGKPTDRNSVVTALKHDLIGSDLHRLTPYTTSLQAAKNVLLKHDPLLNQYFRILYQILKFVATNSPNTSLVGHFNVQSLEDTTPSANEKFYSNIVRSFVPETVYYLLAVNCFTKNSQDPYRPYKLLVERYEFFEHMPLRIPDHQNRELLDNLVAHYKPTAFGSNADYGQRG
ncbi:putative phage abortive infection protein [Uliginosibacterium aquaticum]|uniref:Phage abortive infection protein n=1 Tax=Uliginosibacterium aquaticum TaxID=2731212 RepID=A0ABX2IGQ1_9RHOO|nr:putative phage abortive infection protein [Uliginosibacterium aquaticum]NSL55904.1 hypothetical protein [Uliginosibacterium aquaticum]